YRSSQGIAAVGDPGSENVSSPAEVGSSRSVYRLEWGGQAAKKIRCSGGSLDQRIQARELEIKNLEARLETEAGMKKATEDKSAMLIKELEDLRAQFSDLQVENEHLSQ
nr:hypothetical protein [Tanacetum cinerariifolium]